MTDYHLAVISAGRPASVERMQPWLAADGLPTAVWYVPPGDAADYRYAGAERVVPSGALCVSRNVALADADGRPCLQLSDDLRGLGVAHGPKRDQVEIIGLPRAIAMLHDALAATPGAHLAGPAPTANPFYSRERIHTTGYILGDLTLVTGTISCPTWDERLRLKEDYDYTLAHLARYGAVARVDNLLANFAHRTNRGGAVAIRTPEVEQEAIAYLMAKWPGALRPNPRRPNEVLMRWPGRP